MTLYLEFLDGYTGQLFGKVLDRQIDDKGDMMITANRVTNQRDGDQDASLVGRAACARHLVAQKLNIVTRVVSLVARRR